MAVGFEIDKFPGSLTYAKLSQLLADAGYVLPAYEQNADTGGGISLRRSPIVSAQRRLAVGLATNLFDHQFNSATQNTGRWRYLSATMTMTQGTGSLIMNASSTVTTTTGTLLSTWRQFQLPGNGSLRIEIEILFTEQPLANQTVLAGLYPHVSATVLPSDGVYFKYTSAGLIGVSNFNGTETVTAVLLTPADFTNNKFYTLRADITDGNIDFWRDDRLLGSLTPANANPEGCLFAALPVSLQFYNPGVVTGSPVMQAKIGNISVTQRDLNTQKPWPMQQALAGLMAYQGQEGGTQGTTALYTNSLAAGAGAAMTNTTAALGSGLGGQFSVQPTLAVGTDGIVCSYQVPAGSAAQPPRNLVITGVRVQGAVTTALTGGPVVYAYSLAFGHTAVTLATAESGTFVTGTAKAARRIALGVESYAAAAAVGAIGAGVYMPFASPIVVHPGEFVAIVAKNLGVVTTAGVISLLVTFDAFLE